MMRPELPAQFVVTGSSGTLGRLLVDQLLALPSTRCIVGIDVRPAGCAGGAGKPPPVTDARFRFHRADVVDGLRSLSDFPPRACWLHLAYPLDPQCDAAEILRTATSGTSEVLRTAERAQAAKIVVFSSTMAYGVRSAPAFLTEDSALSPPPEMAYAEGKRRLEAIVAAWPPGAAERVVARPCTVLGPRFDRHGMSDAFAELPAVEGHDPRLQFLHETDLVDAVLRLLPPGVTGVFNLAPSDGGVRCSELRRLLGIEAPEIAYEELRRAHARDWAEQRAGALPPSVLDYLVFEWIAANDKARAVLGWEPGWSSLDTFWSYIRTQQRKVRSGRAEARAT